MRPTSTDALRRTGSHPFLTWLERLLLLVGLVLVGYLVYVSVETHLYQEMENRELDAILTHAPEAPARS